MLGQIDNKLLPSFALYLDHLILSKGQAFTNYSGTLYPQQSQYSNYYTYSAPFAQLVYDTSISGATINTGIYVNSVLVSTGISGFVGWDFQKGQAIFSINQNAYTISGHYSVKDENVKLTNDAEETILFKNKYQLKNAYPLSITGVPNDTVTFPIIYLRDDFSDSQGFALGGTDQINHTIRAIVLTDSLFSLHAIQSICRDNVRTLVPLFEASEMPFNPLGVLRSGTYSYTGARYPKINEHNYGFIEEVRIPRQSQNYTTDAKLLNPNVFFNFIDFDISIVGNWRWKG